jgi:hypothetical protein
MDPISLILAALIAGATTGVSKSAANAVQDAYAGFRDALKRRLAGKAAAQQAVDEYPSDPDQWKGNLENHLKAANADQDQAVIDAASEFLGLADPAGASAGKYRQHAGQYCLVKPFGVHY